MSDADFSLSEAEVVHDSIRLHVKTVLPTSAPWARLLIVHGYGEHCGRYLHFMRWLAGKGIACTTLDQRGHGRSSGRRGFVRQWEEYFQDLAALLDLAAARTDQTLPPLFVFAHSHGGLIGAAAGERGMFERAGVIGCMLSSPYLRTRVRIPRYKRALAHAANRIIPWLRVGNGFRHEWVTRDPEMMIEDKADTLMNRSATPRWYLTMRRTQKWVMAEAGGFKLPLLCLAGTDDVVADPAATAEFYRRAGSTDKSLYVYPGFVHELVRDVGRRDVFEDVLDWMKARAFTPDYRSHSHVIDGFCDAAAPAGGIS